MLLLGPIVGLVTESTVRILFEVTTSCEANITISTPSSSFSIKRHVYEGSPTTVVIRDLLPSTRYTVKILLPADVTDFGIREGIGMFITSPKKAAVLSCNNQHHSGTQALDHLADHLPDICFHIGDQIYTDYGNDVFEHVLRENTYIGMVSIYRNAYRRAWNTPVMKRILSSCSNVMLADDHDIVDSWDSFITLPSSWRDTIDNGWEELANTYSTKKEKAIIAGLQAYTEYQLSLVGIEKPGSFALSIDNDVLYFIDTRIAKAASESILPRNIPTHPGRELLDTIPSIILTPVPPFFLPSLCVNRFTAKIGSMFGLRDIYDQWNLNPSHLASLYPLLASSLIIAGDAHMQGKTLISLQNENGNERILQVTTSGISSPLPTRILRILLFLCKRFSISIGDDNIGIQHEYWSRNNGYAKFILSDPQKIEHIIPSLL